MSVSLTEIGHGENNSSNNNSNTSSSSSSSSGPHEYYQVYRSSSISEIEEEDAHAGSGAGAGGATQNGDVPVEIRELFEIKKFAPMPSIREEQYDCRGSVTSNGEDCVYVAVGKSASSMDALDWTLKHVASPSPSIMVYLVHIFPEIRLIPTPLGKLPLSQVSPEQVEHYMAQERGKRRELLQRFLHKCSAASIKVDTVLIESDALPKAILDLIAILKIKKIVVGTAKSSLRKLRSGKGTGFADQILKSAPETCEVKIICEGTEVIMDQMSESSPSSRGNNVDNNSSKELDNSKSMQDVEEDQREEPISCMCFRSKFA
ncbi:Rossmann-like alpha/beta/alpha sandwich fold containing protein [Trema orientale]|uniref:Rossmann-like alpha/beta/alpha sandwich fold containing protein n=1 Tax=Trema orientale TaxID=63057 RepID=A0A2P5EXQ4_TREOI|nr:Rossmann-like alpha/beta/alpha sandwich fold containing protein [Trema orientale]